MNLGNMLGEDVNAAEKLGEEKRSIPEFASDGLPITKGRFFLCSCLSQRRRRKAGRQPFYGTGWTQNLPFGGGNSYGNNYQNKPSYQAPPPQYGQENNYNQHEGFYGQNTGGQNQSYFGGRQTELEMQPPQNVYGARDQSGFAPPPGPPPSKVH